RGSGAADRRGRSERGPEDGDPDVVRERRVARGVRSDEVAEDLVGAGIVDRDAGPRIVSGDDVPVPGGGSADDTSIGLAGELDAAAGVRERGQPVRRGPDEVPADREARNATGGDADRVPGDQVPGRGARGGGSVSDLAREDAREADPRVRVGD